MAAQLNERTHLLQADESDFSDGSSLNKPTQSIKVYKRRWYILFLFSAQAIVYNMTWNTWGPIQEPCKVVFGWSDREILLLTSSAAVAFILAAVPSIWLMDTKGLRVSILLASLLMAIGKALQDIPFSDHTTRTVMLIIGQFVIMTAGPVACCSPPLLSATWFPPHERTTATAIATLSGTLGLSMAFFIGPALVPASNSSSNSTGHVLIEHQIADYLWCETGIAVVVFLCVLVYFPSKPPLPPSLSSSVSHLSGKKGFMFLLKNGSFWLLAGLCGISLGIYLVWVSVLDVILAKFGIDQTTAGLLGCYSTLAAICSGILVARFADLIKHKTKQLLMFLLALAASAQLIFALSCVEILPASKAILYTSIIAGGLFYTATLPLYFELAMEGVYPVAEGLTGGVLMTVGSVVPLVFYLGFMLPHSNISWMNWIFVVGIAVAVPGMWIYQEKYTRLELDTGNCEVQTSPPTEESLQSV